MTRYPLLFLAHGSPMNAIELNEWSRGYRSIAEALPRPKAILVVSAHWFVPGCYVTDNDHPRTIHDFSGFPRELFDVQYPAPGDPRLAKRIVELIGSENASLRSDWGLDHGSWSILKHLFPAADIPVVQLSIDRRLLPHAHLELGRKLKPLREEDVLIIGSGNITHNLPVVFNDLQQGNHTTPDWAKEFDDQVATALGKFDTDFLLKCISGSLGKMSHPTVDHYLPLLYVVGAAERDERIQFPIVGFDLGSLSMRSVRIG